VPFFLRKIRKAKWYKNENVSWLAEGELQADALSDLETKNNELSVWYVEDDKSNLEQIAAALAASGDAISNLDYALLDQEVLSEVSIKVRNTRGGSPDKKVNSWHRDLVELSATALFELAKAIQTKATKERILPRDIGRLIKRAVDAGQIDRTKLKPGVAAKLDSIGN